MNNLKQRLETYVLELLVSEQWDKEGFSFWLDRNGQQQQCTLCTGGAMMIAMEFGGKVMGYRCPPGTNPNIVGEFCYGHDIAVVEEYLIDYWAAHVEGCIPSAIMRLDDPIVQARYNPSAWELVQDFSPEKV